MIERTLRESAELPQESAFVIGALDTIKGLALRPGDEIRIEGLPTARS